MRWEDTPAIPTPDVLGRNGSYVVFRKLHQRVAAFRQYLKANASGPEGEELLAAKMMGRWRSGAPLALCPLHDDPELGADRARSNAFLFKEDDAIGYHTPCGSHIRRMNPRDADDCGCGSHPPDDPSWNLVWTAASGWSTGRRWRGAGIDVCVCRSQSRTAVRIRAIGVDERWQLLRRRRDEGSRRGSQQRRGCVQFSEASTCRASERIVTVCCHKGRRILFSARPPRLAMARGARVLAR